MKYSASLDTMAKGITLFITLVFIFVISLSIYSYEELPNAALFIPPAFLCVIYILVLLYRPTSYKIENRNLYINRIVGSVIFEIKKIEHVEQLEKTHLRWSLRTFGVGGMFGYFGRFYNQGIGKMKWYVTRRDTAVLLTFKSGKNVVVSPDDPEKFIEQINTDIIARKA